MLRHILRSLRARRTKYIAVAVLATASAGVATVDFHRWQQVLAFTLSLIVSACVAARAYNDLSASKP